MLKNYYYMNLWRKAKESRELVNVSGVDVDTRNFAESQDIISDIEQ